MPSWPPPRDSELGGFGEVGDGVCSCPLVEHAHVILPASLLESTDELRRQPLIALRAGERVAMTFGKTAPRISDDRRLILIVRAGLRDGVEVDELRSLLRPGEASTISF